MTIPAAPLAGRRVAVTGATGGIGRAIVLRLQSDGAAVIGLDRRVGEPLPAGAPTHEVDITDPAAVAAVVGSLYDEDPHPIDLVNSAGIVEDDVAAEEMAIEQFDAVLAVNLRAVFITCQAFGRELLNRGGGAIVNIASMSGTAVVNAPQKQSAYNTSKAGVAALTRSLAVEWGTRGVRINSLSPGYVDTPLNALKAHMHELWRAGTVAGRFAEPAEVAAATAFLLGPDAGYFLGSDLLMDGGYTLR